MTLRDDILDLLREGALDPKSISIALKLPDTQAIESEIQALKDEGVVLDYFTSARETPNTFWSKLRITHGTITTDIHYGLVDPSQKERK